ncbi:TIGR00297 family protein [Paenibacillus sp. UNCCL117]|nr:TIGR00297 family protein [Paenibacillus sp. cl123]SFW18711.1 TIGR00297 family protein [Paenibacillus sp. UNCCL117]
MSYLWMDGIIGISGSLLIAGAAYWKRSLSASGAAAAVVLGSAMYMLGSAPWFGTLIAFFISSSLLSKWKRRRKAEAESGYAKGGRRDAGQVLANGGLGLVLCGLAALWPHNAWWFAYLGVMATVTADTWATEIGGLSKRMPRFILTGREVPPGTSGGITPLGLAASAAGGLFIGFVAWSLGELQGGGELLGQDTARSLPVLLGLCLAGGICGSLADSWLGAVCQAMYRCKVCGKDIEKNRHCEAEAVRTRGFNWMTNDVVNAISSLAGGLISALMGFLYLTVI